MSQLFMSNKYAKSVLNCSRWPKISEKMYSLTFSRSKNGTPRFNHASMYGQKLSLGSLPIATRISQ